MPTIELRPIEAGDAAAVAEFLHANLDGAISAADWARAVDPRWQVDRPNLGFMLRADGEVVGTLVALYSERRIDGETKRLCNLGAWCVRADHRFHSLRLLKAALAQPGYHFTDLSPVTQVAELDRRLGFRDLDTRTALVANLPRPARSRRVIVTSDPMAIEQLLDGEDLRIYRDHVGVGSVIHVALAEGEERCYVMLRSERRKRVPLAALLHVTNPSLLRRHPGRFASHLLLRHRFVGQLAELRLIGYRPRLSVDVRPFGYKLYRSPDLRPDQVDYLYSELVCLPG